MSSELSIKLTPLQIQKLSKAGIDSMYKLLTYFPYKLDFISPFHNSEKLVNQKYLLNGYISRYELVSRGIRFFKIDVSGADNIQLYLFNSAPYIVKMLNQSCEFQFIIVNKNGFWTIERLAEKTSVKENSFVLGKAALKNHILPKYTRILSLTDTTLNSIHQRLQKSDYILNLKGLVPPNNLFIPEQIDLYGIHHPNTKDIFYTTQKQYTSLQVFLRITLLKNINLKAKNKLGLSSVMDTDYIKKITQQFPYTLSNSQKITIWEILKDLSN
jgi:RecG-like helicase